MLGGFLIIGNRSNVSGAFVDAALVDLRSGGTGSMVSFLSSFG